MVSVFPRLGRVSILWTGLREDDILIDVFDGYIGSLCHYYIPRCPDQTNSGRILHIKLGWLASYGGCQVTLGPGPGEKAWQVCGILPCIFHCTDELEEAQACSLSRSESTKAVDFQRVQDKRSHGFNLCKLQQKRPLHHIPTFPPCQSAHL